MDEVKVIVDSVWFKMCVVVLMTKILTLDIGYEWHEIVKIGTFVVMTVVVVWTVKVIECAKAHAGRLNSLARRLMMTIVMLVANIILSLWFKSFWVMTFGLTVWFEKWSGVPQGPGGRKFEEACTVNQWTLACLLGPLVLNSDPQESQGTAPTEDSDSEDVYVSDETDDSDWSARDTDSEVESE
jgi:hypothetical protein